MCVCVCVLSSLQSCKFTRSGAINQCFPGDVNEMVQGWFTSVMDLLCPTYLDSPQKKIINVHLLKEAIIQSGQNFL